MEVKTLHFRNVKNIHIFCKVIDGMKISVSLVFITFKTPAFTASVQMLPEYQAQLSQQARTTDADGNEQLFESCDVVETSYHFLAHNINLHLSDDPGERFGPPSILDTCVTLFVFFHKGHHRRKDCFSQGTLGKDNVRPVIDDLQCDSVEELEGKLKRTLLWTEARDVWPDSSDSDYYNLGVKSVLGDLMFRSESIEDQNDAIDIGSEALEEDEQSIATMSITTPSENPSNTSYNKRKDLISIATVKLGQCEIVQYSQGLKSTLKAHVSNVELEECPAIPWDEFQCIWLREYGPKGTHKLSNCWLLENKEGAFTVEPLDGHNVSPISQETIDLKQENYQLRRKLAAMERLTEENHRLRKCEEEAQELSNSKPLFVNTLLLVFTLLAHSKQSLVCWMFHKMSSGSKSQEGMNNLFTERPMVVSPCSHRPTTVTIATAYNIQLVPTRNQGMMEFSPPPKQTSHLLLLIGPRASTPGTL
ncbi:unnamed protein product [Nesidiocoris tenuis]|uniref:Uncharacterized protein n=1 Tax=Nesidiocoris tenuis TaxID=355587 RepID=A0A6H5HC01_9HEMI|nr:unnamed protein product [Nesidiocoris tenuis]